MRLIKLFIFILFSLVQSLIFGQIKAKLVVPDSFITKASLQYDFTNLGIKEGLPSSSVYNSIQTKKGDFWIGTAEGLCKFNGIEIISIKNDSLIFGNTIWSLFEDHKGTIWCGPNNRGAVYYDGKKFTQLSCDSLLKTSTVIDIQEDSKGGMWFSTVKGLAYYYKNKVSWLINKNDSLSGVYKTYIYKDRVYICTKKGVYYYENNTLKKYLSGRQDILNCRSLFIDSIGNHYIGTWGSGLFIHFVKEDSTVNYNRNELTNNVIWDIKQDHLKRIWLATDYGINVYDNGSLHAITEKEGLSNNRTWSLSIDNINRVWISCYGGGISIFNGDLFSYSNALTGFTDKQINVVLTSSNGTIWFATSGGGLIKLKNGVYTHFYDNNLFRDHYVWNLYEEENGVLWICADAALVKYENGTFYKYTKELGMISDLIWSITKVSEKEYYIGTYDKGIMVFNKDSFYSLNINVNARGVYKLFKDDEGRVWAVTSSGPVVIVNQKAIVLNRELGVFSNKVSDIKQDPYGNIWIASGKGITVYKKDTPLKNFIYLNKSNGVDFENISNIQFTSDSTAWLGAKNGVYFIVFSINSNELVVKESQFFSSSSGFREIEVSGISYYDTLQKKYFFPTPKGVTIANLTPVKKLVPSIELKKIELFYDNIDWSKPIKKNLFGNEIKYFYDSLNNLPVELELPYHVNHITFKFQGGNTRNVAGLMYSFFLEGAESGWSPPSPSREVTFSNLPHGRYIFKVKSIDENNNESQPFVYSFVIHPPLWNIWWVQTLGIITFILVIILIFRARTNQLRKNKIELEKTVKERTVELFEQKSLIEQKNKEITDSISYAKRIQKAILPSQSFIKSFLNECFILFLPKELVAGDFYWIESKENKLLIAVADCTGHGVPGAMVSVVCHNALNRCVRELSLTKPSEILDKTRLMVIETFEKSDEEVKDGMDISICSIDFDKKILHWAGANNPLWIIRNDKLLEYKPDKQPIAKYYNMSPFSNHEISLQTGDCLYLFTDGFADQFGGPKGKKYKYTALKKLLLKSSKYEMEKQQELIYNEFKNWKKTLEQVDDICIIGIRV